jgi:hypothetical protein
MATTTTMATMAITATTTITQRFTVFPCLILGKQIVVPVIVSGIDPSSVFVFHPLPP